MLNRSEINQWMQDAGWQNSSIRQADFEKVCRVVSAATAPLLEQIAERDKRIAELEQQLEAVRKDAERWRTAVTVGAISDTSGWSDSEIENAGYGDWCHKAIDAAMKEQK